MEPQQQQQQGPNDDSSGKGNFICRQSSARWTPTTDQIRILKDLYYNNGVRSPSADQIQRISARLRQYGKIEGKNVFYWFQNHKARERQKKLLTSTTDLHIPPPPMQKPNPNINITPGSSPSSTGVLTVGQIRNYGCGSMAMEKSFRDCTISAYGSSSGGATESLSHNIGWVCMDPTYTSSYAFFDKKKITEDEEETKFGRHIETLPLFPMNGQDINAFCSNVKHQSESCYSAGWYRTDDDGYSAASASRASLELTLNSYTPRSHDSIS